MGTFIRVWAGITVLMLASVGQSASIWLDRQSGFSRADYVAIQHHQWATIIVELPDASVALSESAKVGAQQRVTQWQIAKQQMLSQRNATFFKSEQDFSHLPLMAVTVSDVAELDQLIESGAAKAIYSNDLFYLSLAQSLPLIKQPEV